MAKGKKKANWVLIIAVMFILGGIMALIEKIKESAHPALYFTIFGIVVVGLLVGAVFLFLRLSKPSKKGKTAEAAQKTEPVPAPAPRSAEKYEFYPVKTVGVTFNNDDGTSRQELIEKMYYKDPPFEDKELQLELEPYEYKGEPAFKVVVNGCQIGNLSRHDAKYAARNMDRFVDLCGAEIVGGDVPKDDDYDLDDDGENEDYECEHKYDYDEPLTWGFHFIIKYSK